jgi:transcriptional regulator with XRE-family HTH domain
MGGTVAGATTVLVPSLRHYRTLAALRQSELAGRAGVHEASVRRGERGHPLQLATVRSLAEALGVTPAQLQAPPPG